MYSREYRNAYMRSWYAKNREKVRNWTARYYKANRDIVLKKRRGIFKERERAYAQRWRRDNPERLKLIKRRYYDRNKIQISDHARKWRVLNRDRLKTKARQYYLKHRINVLNRSLLWQKNNPGLVRARTQRRRARTRNAIRGCQKRVNNIYKRCRELRKWFDVSVDHIIPLAFGGAHSANNLQIIYRSENTRKRDNPFYTPRVVFK